MLPLSRNIEGTPPNHMNTRFEDIPRNLQYVMKLPYVDAMVALIKQPFSRYHGRISKTLEMLLGHEPSQNGIEQIIEKVDTRMYNKLVEWLVIRYNMQDVSISISSIPDYHMFNQLWNIINLDDNWDVVHSIGVLSKTYLNVICEYFISLPYQIHYMYVMVFIFKCHAWKEYLPFIMKMKEYQERDPFQKNFFPRSFILYWKAFIEYSDDNAKVNVANNLMSEYVKMVSYTDFTFNEICHVVRDFHILTGIVDHMNRMIAHITDSIDRGAADVDYLNREKDKYHVLMFNIIVKMQISTRYHLINDSIGPVIRDTRTETPDIAEPLPEGTNMQQMAQYIDAMFTNINISFMKNYAVEYLVSINNTHINDIISYHVVMLLPSAFDNIGFLEFLKIIFARSRSITSHIMPGIRAILSRNSDCYGLLNTLLYLPHKEIGGVVSVMNINQKCYLREHITSNPDCHMPVPCNNLVKFIKCLHMRKPSLTVILKKFILPNPKNTKDVLYLMNRIHLFNNDVARNREDIWNVAARHQTSVITIKMLHELGIATPDMIKKTYESKYWFSKSIYDIWMKLVKH
jgi:hypothetical protein